MTPQPSQFKSAEEWLDDMFSKGNWVTADTVTLRGVQSNTMREAARIVRGTYGKYLTNPVYDLEQAATQIEKGEYKPV